MNLVFIRISLILLLHIPINNLKAQPIHSIDVIAGAPLNLDSKVTFQQAGEEDISLIGQYISKPFEDPFLFSVLANPKHLLLFYV